MVGVSTAEGSVLKIRSIRKAENCSFRVTGTMGNTSCASHSDPGEHTEAVHLRGPSKVAGCQPSRSLGWARNHFPKVDSIG